MIVFWVLGFLAVAYLLNRRLLSKHSPVGRLPPGPKPWPVVGNVMDLPTPGKPEHEHWLSHKDTYGPISSVTVFGRPMIILHDREALHELMEKTSLKTSGRPEFEFANLCGYDQYFSLQGYTDEFRRGRKFVHKQFGTKELVSRNYIVLEEEAAHLLLRVLETPQDLVQHIKTKTGAIILKIAYGYVIEPKGVDPLVKLIENMMVQLSASFVPMAWAVDMVPALRFLPDWFPGCSFKKTARLWSKVNQAVIDLPYAFALQRLKEGTGRPCYVSRNVEEITKNLKEPLTAEDSNVIKTTAGIIYAGASDTTVSTLTSFVLAMIKFPHIQRRAQREIDDLTGGHRLPGFADREKLPYIEAIVKEALRWFPIVPMGPPHAVEQETTVRGYHVPKGTYILPSIWWLLHDPKVYANPETFEPARFLSPRDEPDPVFAAFGFGRRVCPGRHLADTSLFLTISQLLATFDMEKALDGNGRPIEPHAALQSGGLISRPVSFPYRIVPRSPKHAELIRNTQLDYPLEDGDASSFPGKKELHELLEEVRLSSTMPA